MKNKLIFLLITIIVFGAVVVKSAEATVDSKQSLPANQAPESVVTALQAKLGQTRALLVEIQDMLAQATKNMDKILDENKHAEKNKAALEEYNRLTGAISQEIKNTRGQVKETDKRLAEYTKQIERLSRLQSELEKAQKERIDSEADVRQAEAKLAEARKNLDDMKNSLSELAARTEEAKTMAQKMQSAKSLLEAEKNKRAETLARAEDTVARTDKAEKERLLLASRLAELGQTVPSPQKQQKESADLAAIQGEIEKESAAIRETEEKIKKDEKAREDAERNIMELKKQLQERAKPGNGGDKEGSLNTLKDKLAGILKQRSAAESRLKEADEQLRNSQNSAESLANTFGAEDQKQKNEESSGSAVRVRIQGEIENELKAFEEAKNTIAQKEKACEETEKTIAELQQKLKEFEKNTRSDSAGKGSEIAGLQSQLANIKKQRDDVDRRLKTSEKKLRENEQVSIELANKLAAENQRLKNEETLQTALRARIQGEMENGLKAIEENRNTIAQKEKACEETEKTIAELQRKSKEFEKNTRSDSAGKESEMAGLQSQLANIKKQRDDVDKRLKASEMKLREAEKTNTDLANALVSAKIEDEKNKEKVNVLASLTSELGRETALLNETAANVDKQTRDLKALEEEKGRLNAFVVLVRGKLDKAEKHTSQIDDLNQKLAGQKKIRADMESRLGQTAKDAETLRNEIKELNQSLTDSGKIILNNETELTTAERITGELQKEKELARESAGRLAEKEKALKGMGEEKEALRKSLGETRQKIADQQTVRKDHESRMDQVNNDLNALKKEIKNLNQSVTETGKLTANNADELKATEQLNAELQKENELTRKSADLLRGKEENLKRLGEEKDALQSRLNEAMDKLAAQKEGIKTLAANRRAIDEVKKAGKASEQRQAGLAREEKDNKKQINELEITVAATEKENKQLAARSDKISSEIEAGRQAVAGEQAAQRPNTQAAAATSEKDPMAVEQAVLQQAHAGDIQPSAQQPDKKTSKQIRSRQNRISEAEEHYAAGIQKWDKDDVDGAIDEFKKTADLNPEAPGAYYNISLAYLRQGNKKEACKYAFDAGECYVRMRNFQEAARMAVLMTKIDVKSPLIHKLRNKIAVAIK